MGYFLTRIASAAAVGYGEVTLPGLWPEKPSVVAGFSDMTTFYPDGGRDTQGQEISVSVASASLGADGTCGASAVISLLTEGGSVPMSGGDMRRWNNFYLSESHEATFAAASVRNPVRVSALFEMASQPWNSTASGYGRNYRLTVTCGGQSRIVAEGTFARSVVRIAVDETFSGVSGTASVSFKAELYGGVGTQWFATEYAYFNGGAVETEGREELANGSALLLAVGR